MECFEIRDLTFSYPATQKPTLLNLSISVKQGQFVTLCGPSGCGKSTLLRQLKPVLAPHGTRSGEILFEGVPLPELPDRTQSSKIGFVMQSPENQVVTDKVWHELAFGLESLGHDTETIRLRVAEMASFFGIENWFYKRVTELSGGQKQLLNLASVMAMQPSVLILDEPTSQLDPIAAADFLATIGKINRELGTTIIITEHRLEEVFPFADRVLVMDAGKLICDGAPAQVGAELKSYAHTMFLAMPTPMRVYAAVPNGLPCPITVRDGREWLNQLTIENGQLTIEGGKQEYGEAVIELEEVWFRYEKESPDILKGLSCTVRRGEFLAILGGNGTGKSTTLALMSGRKKPYRGRVKISGVPIEKAGDLYTGLLGVLPQNPQALFLRKTVREDLWEMLSERGFTKAQKEDRLRRVAGVCRLEHLLHMHPYDLSGGEQQRTALAKVLLTQPKILMLDEPTKGFDAEFKAQFAEILSDLMAGGATIIMVSHDVEFCAKYARRCAMVFDGTIVSADTPRKFFAGNSFYTTSANRMARHLIPEAVTAEDIIRACGGKVSDAEYRKKQGDTPVWTVEAEPQPEKTPPGKKSLIKYLDAIIAFISLIFTAIPLYRDRDIIKALISGGDLAVRTLADTKTVWSYALLIVLLCAELGVIWNRFRKRPDIEQLNYQVPPDKRVLTKRTLAAVVIVLIAIPLTILFGVKVLDDRQYYFVSMAVIIETMLPFIMIFEGKKPQARELVIIAVLCAIGVAGRTAFFMLPQFKPVIAITIIAGVAFGGEAGFLVGAVTGFVSNFFYGQGPWSPLQMFSFGIIGFLAGLLFRKGILRRNRVALSVFGGIATFIIYGGIMNVASLMMFQSVDTITGEMVIAAYLQGIPFDLLHAVSTVSFLWVISDSMLEKLDRIKLKYGLLEAGDKGALEPAAKKSAEIN